jgi:phage tail sheath protein FI
MPFQLSPGVAVVEKDFTSIVPAVATSTGGFAGDFQWGPVLDPVTINSENNLVQRFGKPTDDNATSFFTAANFLAYTNNLLVVRADATALKNAVADGTAVKIKNTDEYLSTYAGGSGEATHGEFAAKYPGTLGNGIAVSMADGTAYSGWDLKGQFDGSPSTSAYVDNQNGSNDELHIVIYDADGRWTGSAGTILEKFAYVSKASDAKLADGTNNYYKDVINSRSKYVWWMDHQSVGTNWGDAAAGTTFANQVDAYEVTLAGGVNGTPADGDLQDAWFLFADADQYDIRLLPVGATSTTVANYVISNIAESRLDCVAFVSPNIDGSPIIGSGSDATDAINDYRDDLPSSSYAVMDSGYKYQYDRYNDKYRWIPLNGDVAGLCARTDYQADAWFSPGGLNRGQIKNVVKLAHNPTKTDRDVLYKNGVNPVVTFPGQGTVLYGDKTLLAKPSAFDRINVRRLFIVLEKTISTAAKFQLFEFNDTFTRAQFKNLVEPFLRDVQGRRGITDFVVKCDTTNNTGEVIDANEFVADIFVKPNRSINYITLNFVAARSSVAFSEIGQ